MDFMQQLKKRINKTPNLSIKATMGYLGASETLVVYPLPGSQIVAEYMDGTTDQQLNYEIAMKSKSQEKIHNSLWVIQSELESLTDLPSSDDSFQFNNIAIANKPFINQVDEQGWFVFLLEVQAMITVTK